MTIGIDIEDVKRFKLAQNSAFINKIFTPGEQAYAYAHTIPSQHLAGMFCVKEAYCKCIGKGIDFRTIEVRHLASGKPILYRNGKKTTLRVSISHTKTQAAAVVAR